MNIRIPNPSHLTFAALAAGVLCAAGALALSWPMPPGGQTHVIIVPIALSMASLALLCIVALAALEYGVWPAALPVAGGVALLVTATIAAWVLMFAPPFGIALFGVGGDLSESAPAFPSENARNAAIAIALASLALLMLTTRINQHLKRPLAWAAGIALIVGSILAVFATSDLAEWLAWAATACIGVGLASSRHARAAADSAQQSDWGARVRALIVVTVIALTLILWHAVRAAEISQLQSETNSAARMAVEEWRRGITDRLASTDRLRMHWEALDWNLPDAVFLSDSQTFMRDYPGIHALAITDAQGKIVKLAQRDIELGATPTDQDRAVLLRDVTTLPAGVAEHTAEVSRAAIAALSRIRTREPDIVNGVELIQSAAPTFNSSGRAIGAMVVVFRRDINDSLLLGATAPDFHVRVFTNGIPTFNRPALGEDAAEQTPTTPSPYAFTATQQVRLNFNDYVFELTPGQRLLERNLTAVPGLVLVFAWVALLLLMFALHNERRAYTLARDRERILNESLDVICTLDANGRYVTVNARSQDVLGYAPKELIGKHYSEIAHPDERPILARQWDDAQRGIPLPSMPLRFVHKNGATVYLQGNAQWSKQERLFFCDMRDVSEQHALELARRHAADTLDAGVEQAGCVVYELDYDTQTIHWVGAAAALTGYTADELRTAGFEGWMALIHPDNREHVRDTFRRCFASRQPHSIDYQLRRKSGEYIPVLDRGRYVDDAHAQPRMIGALIDLTAIRQQELALRRSEERYRIIATQVGALILERDVRTGLGRIFGPVEQIFGFTKEQVEGRPMPLDDTMVHAEDRARVSAAFEHAERNLSSFYIEYRRRHRGGHYIHIAARGVVLPGPNGKAERSVVALTDITERKQSEQRLLESEERFRLAAEQARQIVYEFTYDDQLRIESMRFAGATEALLGYTMDEFAALHRNGHLSLFHPDDLPVARNLPAAVVNQMGSFQVEHRMRHRDGGYVYVENRAAARRDANGNLVAIVGMLLDISARKAAEAQRHTYTEQLGKLADIARKVSTLLSVHDLLHYLARSMRELIGANAAAAAVHEASAGEEKAIAVSFAGRDDTQRGSNAASANASLGSEPLYALLDGANKPVRLTAADIQADARFAELAPRTPPLRGWLAAPLIGRDGVPLGLLELTDKIDGEFTDSDAQVLSQLAGLASVAIENIRLYATLEERVAARTRELQLSNRELEAFSYSVSHDLRAPLRAIAGFSSILEQEYASKLDAGARRYIQRIGHGVERMANLIDDLLSLARVSRLDLKRETVDLTALSKTIVKRHVERWPDRTIQIKIDPRMRADADPRLVEVALENLVENAIKFTGTREQAQVHIGRHNANGRSAFFVRDNGVGFDPQYAANLFGVFQRLHSASEFPGTGVGLATVQRIVQRHHGRVWAESQLDHGATFYFTFDNEA